MLLTVFRQVMRHIVKAYASIRLETYCSEARIILLSMGSTGSSAILRPSWTPTNKNKQTFKQWKASFIQLINNNLYNSSYWWCSEAKPPHILDHHWFKRLAWKYRLQVVNTTSHLSHVSALLIKEVSDSSVLEAMTQHHKPQVCTVRHANMRTARVKMDIDYACQSKRIRISVI